MTHRLHLRLPHRWRLAPVITATGMRLLSDTAYCILATCCQGLASGCSKAHLSVARGSRVAYQHLIWLREVIPKQRGSQALAQRLGLGEGTGR